MGKLVPGAWLVMASSGEYEMHTTRPVAICPTQVQAERLVAAAQAVADQLWQDANGDWLLLSDHTSGLNPFDPQMSFVLGDAIRYFHAHVPFAPTLRPAGLGKPLPSVAKALAQASQAFRERVDAPDEVTSPQA
jgi:hypothetical protein